MLAKLVKRQATLRARYYALRRNFNAAARGELQSPALDAFMAERGFDPEGQPLTQMEALEKDYVGTIYDEISSMDRTALASLRQVRLLLKTPRQAYRRTSDESLQEAAPFIAYDIRSLMDLGVPELIKTSANFLTTAHSYNIPPHDPDVAQGNITAKAERAYVQDGIDRSPLSDAELAKFYSPYTDMSDDPRRDYLANLQELARLHLEIATHTLHRIDVRTQGIYVLFHQQSRGALRVEAIPGFAEKVTETANMFISVDRRLNQSSAQLPDGTWRRRDGAQDFIQRAQSWHGTYPEELTRYGLL